MTRTLTAIAAAVLLAALAHAQLHASAAPQTKAGSRAPDALRAQIYPRMSRAPALVRIQVLVEPNDDNRSLQFVLDSSSYFRSSTVALNGADAPRLHSVEFRFVPVGAHDVRVSVIDRSGTVRAIVHDRVVILD